MTGAVRKIFYNILIRWKITDLLKLTLRRYETIEFIFLQNVFGNFSNYALKNNVLFLQLSKKGLLQINGEQFTNKMVKNKCRKIQNQAYNN